MGVVVFAALALYLIIVIFVIKRVEHIAKTNGKRPLRWGLAAALVMYLIPFWDLLPTIIAEKYHCETDAGFFVYKAIDQWEKENPGVMETLSMTTMLSEEYVLPDGTNLTPHFNAANELMYVDYETVNGEKGSWLNERFRRVRKSQDPGILKLKREEYIVIDSANDEILARQIDYQKTTKGKIWGVPGDSWWKFWFQSYNSCRNSHPEKFPNGGFHHYVANLRTDCSSAYTKTKVSNGIAVSCPR